MGEDLLLLRASEREEDDTGVSVQAGTSVFYPCVGVIMPPLSLPPSAGQSPFLGPAQKALCQGESDRSSDTFNLVSLFLK